MHLNVSVVNCKKMNKSRLPARSRFLYNIADVDRMVIGEKSEITI